MHVLFTLEIALSSLVTQLDLPRFFDYRRVMVMRHALSWSWSHGAVFLGAGVFFLLSGCKSKASPASGEGTPDAKTGSAAPAGIAPGTTSGARGAAATVDAKCPAGRWSYDYSDQALEVMMKKVAGAKVLKKEGSFICDVSKGPEGTIVCETQGKPVLNVVETNQTGMKMTISITIDGKASTRFALLDSQRMKVLSSDTSALKVGTDVTVAGKKIAFPAEQLISIFGKPQSTMSYKCEGGNLAIKPEIANTETVWQELKPVK